MIWIPLNVSLHPIPGPFGNITLHHLKKTKDLQRSLAYKHCTELKNMHFSRSFRIGLCIDFCLASWRVYFSLFSQREALVCSPKTNVYWRLCWAVESQRTSQSVWPFTKFWGPARERPPLCAELHRPAAVCSCSSLLHEDSLMNGGCCVTVCDNYRPYLPPWAEISLIHHHNSSLS